MRSSAANPEAGFAFGGGCTNTGMPCSRAYTAPPQEGAFVTTAATSASNVPSKIAAWIALKLEPPPETKTAKRFFGAVDVDGDEPMSGGENVEARVEIRSALRLDGILL